MSLYMEASIMYSGVSGVSGVSQFIIGGWGLTLKRVTVKSLPNSKLAFLFLFFRL